MRMFYDDLFESILSTDGLNLLFKIEVANLYCNILVLPLSTEIQIQAFEFLELLDVFKMELFSLFLSLKSVPRVVNVLINFNDKLCLNIVHIFLSYLTFPHKYVQK